MPSTSVLLLLALIITSAVLTSVHSYASGPPVAKNPEVCGDMFPSGHKAVVQATPSPYKIIFNSDNCYADATLPITG